MRTIAEVFRSYAEFDAAGRHVNGTDKESNHRYGDAYESLFQEYDYSSNLCPPTPEGRRSCPKCGSDTSHMVACPDYAPNNRSTRDKVKLVMEVGVADGSCLLAWREVFPNATIVGMDIHHSDKAHGERIEFHLGDQRVQRDCQNAASGRHDSDRQFDLIVDDGTHLLEDTLRTLLFLWPYVRPGGLYVVEEWPDVVGPIWSNIVELWPAVEVVNTDGPFGGNEPLVVFRKPT